MSWLRISSLYTIWQIYSAAEPVPWRNCFYVVTLIVIFPKKCEFNIRKKLLNNWPPNFQFCVYVCVCVVKADLCDYVGQNMQTALLRPNYFLRSTWHTMIGLQQLGQALCLHMATLIVFYTLHLVHGNMSALLFFKWAYIFKAFPGLLKCKTGSVTTGDKGEFINCEKNIGCDKTAIIWKLECSPIYCCSTVFCFVLS